MFVTLIQFLFLIEGFSLIQIYSPVFELSFFTAPFDLLNIFFVFLKSTDSHMYTLYETTLKFFFALTCIHNFNLKNIYLPKPLKKKVSPKL